MLEEHNDQDGYQLMKNLLMFSHSLCLPKHHPFLTGATT